MKRKILYLALLSSVTFYSQTQIGSDIAGEAQSDSFGTSVSLSSDGNILAIGAYLNDGNGSDSGHVRIYENNSGTWTQVGSDINGEAEGDNSGWALSLSSDGSILAIGAFGNDDNGDFSGHVRIYENNLGTWTQIGSDINGEAANDKFGTSVSLSSDGNIVAIGAEFNDGNGINSGHVRVYENNSGTWTRLGSDINGEAANDWSGHSVSLSSDGSIVAIGAIQNDGNGSNSGHVRIYENNSGTWTQIGSDIDGEAEGDSSGRSVSLSSDGNIVAIGARFNDGNGFWSGQVRIYENISGDWSQIGSDIDGPSSFSEFGNSVSLSSNGSIVAIGAPENDSVHVYQNNSGTWTQIGSDIDGAFDRAGWSVSLSSDGSIVAIGAIDGYSGRVGVYDLSELLSVEDEFVNQNLSVYPNPTSSKFQIALNSSIALKSVSLLNSLGQEVLKTTQEVLDVSGFSEGVYYLKIETDKGIGVKKVVVK